MTDSNKRPAPEDDGPGAGALVEAKKARTDGELVVAQQSKRPEVKQVRVPNGGWDTQRRPCGAGGGARRAGLQAGLLAAQFCLHMSTFPCTTLLPSCWCNRVQQGPARTSALQAPIMLLSGHGDAVSAHPPLLAAWDAAEPVGSCVAQSSAHE